MSFWGDVLVHTALFLGFLPAFFFLQVSPTQVQSLEKDALNILKPALADVALTSNPNLSQEFNQVVQAGIQEIDNIPSLQSQDSDTQSKNAQILKYLAIVAGIVAPLLLIGGTYLAYRSGEDMVEFFLSNLVVLVFIAISEFAIVGLFFSRFTEIDNDFVKASLLNIPQSEDQCRQVRQWMETFIPPSLQDKFFGP